MNRTKIEWTDWTWNPIKGLCPVGCWYCYARRIYKRFHWEEGLRINLAERLSPRFIKKPSKIFVCSTIEMFHPEIPQKWRDMIFSIIEQCPQHTFQILTKFPENIDRPMPDNVWLGVSITKDENEWKTDHLFDAYGESSVDSKIFISLEPMLGACETTIYSFDDIDWLIIGRLTGYGRKYDPKKGWVEYLVQEATKSGLPVFLKDNLKDIWGEDLIQEMPDALV